MVPSTLIPLNFSLFLQLPTITSFPIFFLILISFIGYLLFSILKTITVNGTSIFHFIFSFCSQPSLVISFSSSIHYLFPKFHASCISFSLFTLDPLWTRKETRLFLFFMVVVIINCDISHSFPEFMINNVKRGYSFDMKHILKFNVILWFENLFIFSLLFPTMRNMRKGKVKYPIKN